MRCRVPFETDAANDYFSREVDAGEFALKLESDGMVQPVNDYVLNLQNGLATLSVRLPEGSRAGDQLSFVANVTDRSRIEPFENRFSVSVKQAATGRGQGGTRRKPPGQSKGDEREVASGIALPKIVEVTRSEWKQHSPEFDQFTALRIRHAGTTGEDVKEEGVQTSVYDFLVNVDNIYFRNELKSSGEDLELKKAQFVNSLVLLGLAILHDAEQRKQRLTETESEQRDGEIENGNVEDRVEEFTRAVAPVLLPVIESLGTLDLEHVTAGDASGEAG
jgi:hypothetical protein